MAQNNAQLDSEDSSTCNRRNSESLKEQCSKLRYRAFRATNKLSLANRKTIKAVGRRVLQKLADSTNSIDANLFRVSIGDSATGLVGLRHHSGLVISDKTAATLKRFPYRLLPPGVQKCIEEGKIAKIRGGSNNGGRLLEPLLRDVNCKVYYLCPIRVDGKVKGLLGLACRHEVPINDDYADEFFELLKLHGTILLTNILRVRRESRRNRKLIEWRRIADQACDFAITLDERFVVSHTAAFGAGDKTPQLNGLRLTDIVDRNFHRELLQQIKTAAETSEVRTTNFQISLDHTGPRWCLARIEPSRRTENAHTTLYLTDNNSDKLLQEEVRSLTDHLVKASRLSLLGQMSTEFAHQLNQPLQAILNYCNMMQRRIERGTASEEHSVSALANIEKSVMHSADIIERIRDFVKFRSLLAEELSLQELIDQAVMMVLPTARGWNADIIPPDDSIDFTVIVDKAQTTHVLVNLMINALEACREFGVDRPRIELFVREDAQFDRVAIGVRDNGPGLPKADPDIVFRKFYSSKEEGLGMGLAISRDVCESQGGSLTARNNVDANGCTFFVSMQTKQSGSHTAELETPDDSAKLPID